ncbi:MAG: phosphatidylserine decarboxylase [Gammaproteobacteria bacterium]|nr:phosphatidylserine decarboxylase [Gammaproteobacteria bacterium]MDH5653710.1 phosphatidylserine decarboxylase [Gammaproteobacteria bacterium]
MKQYHRKYLFSLLTSILMFVAALMSAQTVVAQSACDGSLQYLQQQYKNDKATRKAFDNIYKGLKTMPEGYGYGKSRKNPWKQAKNGKGLMLAMVNMFDQWCQVLPQISGDQDNALDPILYFAWLYYQNPAGQNFVQGRDPHKPGKPLATGPVFLSMWNAEYRVFMDSQASTGEVGQWVKDPRIEIDDYIKTKPEEYKSWNEFFARNLKTDSVGNYPSRPVTMSDRNYVIVAPTDCIMNPLVQVVKYDNNYVRKYIENPLQLDTVLDVKKIPISVQDMLGTLPDELKKKFVGGSGLTCVLMPNTYHHFHAPVDGKMIHAEIVKTGTPGTPGTFGYPDFPNWVPMDGNVGRPGTDFSQFQAFQRGVLVMKVEFDNLPNTQPAKLTGYVASIPVGLDSVGSVVLNECDADKPADRQVNCFTKGGQVFKGKTKLGNFYFGGSLNILLFSTVTVDGKEVQMVSPAVQTRMGNQIGIINIGSSPKSPWSLD